MMMMMMMIISLMNNMLTTIVMIMTFAMTRVKRVRPVIGFSRTSLRSAVQCFRAVTGSTRLWMSFRCLNVTFTKDLVSFLLQTFCHTPCDLTRQATESVKTSDWVSLKICDGYVRPHWPPFSSCLSLNDPLFIFHILLSPNDPHFQNALSLNDPIL